MTPEQALWEQTLERAEKDLQTAEKYGDIGAIEWNKELIETSKRKIREYEEYAQNKRGA
ncbi:hypothetical protein D3C76_662570 [compost metagenome]